MNRGRLKTAFWGAALCMLLCSLTFLFMPLVGRLALGGRVLPTRLLGVWFWLALIAGAALFIIADRGRRALQSEPDSAPPKRKKQPAETPQLPPKRAYPGALRFFSNKWARAADVLCAASILGFALVMLTAPRSYAAYVLLCLLVFTLMMHGTLNGANFSFFTQSEKPKPKNRAQKKHSPKKQSQHSPKKQLQGGRR